MSCRRYRGRYYGRKGDYYRDDRYDYRDDDKYDYKDDDKYDYRDDDKYDYRDDDKYDYRDDDKDDYGEDNKKDYKDDYERHPYPPRKRKDEIQTHVHEFAGSVMLAEKHNHRFAGVTSEAIGPEKYHVHAILVNTDFFKDHYHEIGDRTGPPIWVGKGKHVHFVKGKTTTNDNHYHDYIFTTFIEDPLVRSSK